MSKGVVWASDAMINPRMLRLISHSFDGGPRADVASSARAANDAGKPLSAEHFPPEVFVSKESKTDFEDLGDLFFAGSYWVVSARAAEVLRQFDLGSGGLYPVTVFRKDRKTPIGDGWFCLNFGNVKKAYVGGGEDPAPWKDYPEKQHKPPIILKNDMVEVDETALAGPDVWIDARIYNLFFLSDPLAKALKKVGAAGTFGLKRCQVV